MLALLGEDKPGKKLSKSSKDRMMKRFRANKLKKIKPLYPGQSPEKKKQVVKKSNESPYLQFSNAQIKTMIDLKKRYEYEKERLTRGLSSSFPNLAILSIWYKQKQTEIIKTTNDSDLKQYPQPPDIKEQEQLEIQNDDLVKDWFLKLAIQRYPEKVFNCLSDHWNDIYSVVKNKLQMESPGLENINGSLAIQIMDEIRDKFKCGSQSIIESVTEYVRDNSNIALIGGGLLLLVLLIKK